MPTLYNGLTEKLIGHKDDLPRYSPPDHGGTVNVRLFDRDFCENFEMVLGELEPGGEAHRHSHEIEYQAMYVLSGQAKVTIEDEEPVVCSAGAVIKFPPKVDHHVASLGPDPLKLIIVYSPPLPVRGDVSMD